jgi:flagellar protein FliO/FliZ
MRRTIHAQVQFAIGTILALVSLPLCAATDAALPALSGASPLGGAEILNVGISTLLVVGAILVVGWMYSRMKYAGNSANDMINVVSSRPLGAKERLLLIEVGEKQLLIGMTAAQVQTLHVFDQPVFTSPRAAESTGFAQRLRTAIRGATK